MKMFNKGENVQLSKNFHLSEWECRCNYSDCLEVPVNMDHIEKLQLLRDFVGKLVNITSGHRCVKHNKDVGGVEESQHVKGNATDIKVPAVTPAKLQDMCENFDGLGRYKTFTHVDSRGYKARWGATPDIPEIKAKSEYLPDGPSDEEINQKMSDIEKMIKELLGKG